MIIVEGPDRCGKSSVIDAIQANFVSWGYKYFTNPYKLNPPQQPRDYFPNMIADITGPEYIFSRFIWSEDVYGTVYRGAPGLTDEEFKALEDRIKGWSGIIVHLTDEPENILSRWGKDEMFPPELDKIRQLKELFDEYSRHERRGTLYCMTFTLPQLLLGPDFTKPTETLRTLVHSHVKCIERGHSYYAHTR